MRGFQPQHYADGGLVQRAMSLIGGRKKQIDEATKVAVQPPRQPDPQPVVTSTPDGKFDEKRTSKDNPAGIGFADGGMVRGPGTGTSDDVPDKVREGTYIMPADTTQSVGAEKLASMGKKVPVALSNGEFKMPPEQVHAVGVQALDQMKNATHTPAARGFAPQEAPGAQDGDEPPLFFADGGVVDDEKRRGQPPSPTNIFPGNRLPGASGATSAVPAAGMSDAQRATAIGQVPTGGMTAPAAPPAAPAAPPSVGFMPGTRAVFNESGKAIGDLTGQGRYGAAAGEVARAALSYVPAVADDVIGGAVRAVGPAVMDAGKQFLGFNDSAAPAPAAAAPGTPAAVPSAASRASTTVTGALGGSPASPGAAATAAPPQVMPDVYQHGRGQYSDNAQGMGFAPGFTGQPSAENVAAADALAARSQADSMARLQSRGFAPGGGAPIQQGGAAIVGEDPRAARERRDLVNALTKPVAGARGITAAQRNGMLSLMNQESQAQQAADRNATALEQTRMGNDTQRELTAVREAGENTRAGARNAIDTGRLGLESQVRGFDIRAGERQERLHQKYEAAKTPEEKSAIAQQIRDLSGKQTESPWKVQVTPATKNVDGSTSEGSIVRYNQQTGQYEVSPLSGAGGNPAGPAAPKSKAEYDALPKGAQYVKDGKVLIKS